MFGSSGSGGFGGFGQTPQNTTGTGSVFGSGGGFGSAANTGFGQTGTAGTAGTAGGGFGTGAASGSFGQPQPQQQSSGFGGTGFGSTTNAGFGAKPFGTTPATGTAGLFGNTPSTTTTGFGGFGSNAPTTGGFGSTTTPASTTSGFGKPFGTTTTTAGPTGGLFGTAGATNNTFGGGNTIGFGGAAGTNVPLTGTANPVFSATQEKDPAGATMNHFQTITFMPAYQKFSLEELRLQDYLQGRRYGNESGTGAFGTNTQFGTPFGSTQPTAGGFGTTPATGGLFASNQTQSGTGFGTTTGGFGSTTTGTGGLFGGNKPATGLFGGGTTTNTPPAAGGLFGQPASTGFGNTGTTGAFGTQNQPATAGGLFGSTPATTTTPFGQQPTTGFGQQSGTTGGGLFGTQGTTTTPFGTTQQQQPATGTFGGFGTQATQQQNQPSTFGGFGTQQQNKPPFGGFGSTQPSTGTSLFGNTTAQQQQQQQQPAQSTGLFGNKPFGTTTSSTTGGLFAGGTQPNTTTTGGLFGNAPQSTPASGGLFAGAQTSQQQGGGLFGNKPSSGVFGSTTTTPAAPSGGLFGPTLGTQNQGGLFSSMQQQPNTMGQSGLFNTSLMGSQQGQQPQGFSASINDPNPYGTNLLGASIQGAPGPLATPVGSVQKKKAAMLPQNKIAPRASQAAPRLGASFSKAGSPFAASSSGNTPLAVSGSLGRSVSAGGSRLHLFDTDDTVLNAAAFTPSASHRTASLKKLVIDRNIRDADLFTGGSDLKGATNGQSRDDKPKGILKKVVSFDSTVTARKDVDLFGKEESQHNNASPQQSASPSTDDLGYLRSSGRQKTRDTPEKESSAVSNQEEQSSVGKEVALVNNENVEVSDKGQYWMSPSLATLKSMSKEKLKRVTDLTVGRKGYGQIRFETAVDLTTIDPEDIMDGIVVFQHRICTVYPEHLPKPPPGKGLNVPSTISLEDCFPQYRDTRGPVKDPQHPRYIAHLNRLKSVKDTEFVDYVAAEGIWVFKVKHFTTYGLVDDDDEQGDETFESESTPRREYDESSMLSSDQSYEEGESSVDDSSAVDDTFDFKKLPSLRSSVQSSAYPGDYSGEEESYDDEGTAEEDTTIEMQEESFLGEGSVGSVEDEEEEEGDLDEDEEEPAEPDYTDEVDESVVIQSGGASPEAPATPLLSPAKQVQESTPVGTPALPVARNWTDQLNLTISPVKRRRNLNMLSPMKNKFDMSPTKKSAKKGNSESLNYGHLDLVNDLFSGGGMESPVGRGSRMGSPIKKGQYQESPRLNRASFHAISESECNAIARPVWNARGKLLYVGELVDSSKQGKPSYPKASQLRSAQLKYAPEIRELNDLFELQFNSTIIKLDPYGVPFAELRYSTMFETFAGVFRDDSMLSRQERNIWRLASILFDPLEELTPPHIDPLYYECKMRKQMLSHFWEELVEKEAEIHCNAALTPEEVALAHLSGHRVEQACATLLEANAFRLATLLPLIGGDKHLRQDMAEQIAEWRIRGTLAEISLPIRALYELLSGNTCYSEGLKKPYEDTAASFYMSQQFNLDWMRTFGLKLWYGTTEDQTLGDAVVMYENDWKDHPGDVQKPTAWYIPPEDAESEEYDILWGLLKLHADEHVPLEEALSSKWMDKTCTDYRLPWQLRQLMARRGIRDFSTQHDDQAGAMPELAQQLSVGFAAQLEAQGRWEWAAFVLIHINDTDVRELAVRNLLGRHVEDLEDDSGEKLVFVKDRLLVPVKWIYEAKALHARQLQLHLREAEFLLSAQAWAEAHGTIVQQVAPKAVISGDLEPLRLVLSKFEDVNKVEDWALGGQVYLDYITLMGVKDDIPTALAQTAPTPTTTTAEERPTRRGKVAVAAHGRNDVMQLCKRLLGALPNMERWNFEQKVAVAEMGSVVSGVVLKAGKVMANETPKILSLPLMEDQYLKRTVSLTLEYYKAKLMDVR